MAFQPVNLDFEELSTAELLGKKSAGGKLSAETDKGHVASRYFGPLSGQISPPVCGMRDE